MTVDASSPPPVRQIFGVRSWPWYVRYVRDPMRFVAEAEGVFGPIGALGNPLPFQSGGTRFFLAIGGRFNRAVLGRPDLFRPGGQVMRGPHGSSQARLRQGIFAMYGERHRAHRRLMQPPLTKTEVPNYIPRMAEIIDRLIDGWRLGSEVVMYAERRKLSNWVAAHLLFGSNDFERSVELGQAIERWLLLDADAREHLSYLDLPGSRRRRLLQQAEHLEALILAAIERCRAGDGRSADLLSLIVRAHDRDPTSMTSDELLAHTAILYAASFETTANVLAWTLFLIAQHRDIARQLVDEVGTAFTRWPPDKDALDASPMLDFVLKESMRMMPPVAFTFRTALEDTEVEGVPVRAGDKVLLAHYVTLRDPAVFADPDRFLPGRWWSIRPDTYDYPVFSAGSRLCLGISFAQLELKLTIARILQRVSFRIPDGTRIDAKVQLTLRPVPGIPMLLGPPGEGFAAGALTGTVADMVRS